MSYSYIIYSCLHHFFSHIFLGLVYVFCLLRLVHVIFNAGAKTIFLFS